HDGEFREVEAADKGECSRTLLRRDLDRMRECVPDLPQCHERERWRKAELGRKRRASSGVQGQSAYFLFGSVISNDPIGCKPDETRDPDLLVRRHDAARRGRGSAWLSWR